jgi:hypothetical protein
LLRTTSKNQNNISQVKEIKNSPNKHIVTLLIAVFLSLFEVEVIATAPDRDLATDARILKSFPPGTLELIAKLNEPDKNGLQGRNKQTWLHVRFQMGAAFYTAIACLLNDRAYAERGWRAIDVCFQHQRADGSFEVGNSSALLLKESDNLSGTAFFMARLCQSLILILHSPLGPLYETKIQNLLPRIRLTADFLRDGASSLAKADRLAPNRQFFDAQAFAYAGLLLNDKELIRLGDIFLRSGLARQQPDGAFDEKGGGDSSYQAVSLNNLLSYSLYFPDSWLDSAIERGVSWELQKVWPSGAVSTEGNSRVRQGGESLLGREKMVDYQDVIMSLLYYGTIHHDQRALETAQRTIRYLDSLYTHQTPLSAGS